MLNRVLLTNAKCVTAEISIVPRELANAAFIITPVYQTSKCTRPTPLTKEKPMVRAWPCQACATSGEVLNLDSTSPGERSPVSSAETMTISQLKHTHLHGLHLLLL